MPKPPRDRRPPTPRMRDLVRAVEQLTEKNGYPPSLGELAQRLKVCRGRAQALARGARDRGVVTWVPMVHRSIRTVDVRRQRAGGD